MQKFVTANDEATKKERDLFSFNPLKYSRYKYSNCEREKLS